MSSKIVNDSNRKDYIYREINIQTTIEHQIEPAVSKEERERLEKRHEQVWNHVRKCQFTKLQTQRLAVDLFSDVIAIGHEKQTEDKVSVNLQFECVYESTPDQTCVRLMAYIHRDDFLAFIGLQGVEFRREWRRVRFMATPEILAKHCRETMTNYITHEYKAALGDYNTSEREYREVCEVGPKAIHSDMD